MKLYTIRILVMILSMRVMVSGQESLPIETNTRIDTLSFELTSHNNIVLKAVLNKTDTVRLMLHTAASGVTLIKEVTEKLTKLQWQQGDKVKSWGGENESRYSTYNSLRIGQFQWDSIVIWENENSGPTTDGKFGLDLFKGKVVEMDFDKSRLLIHPNLPAKTTTYKKLPLLLEDGLLFIEGISKVGAVDYPNRFLIHSGYGGTILYDDKFVAESKIGTQIAITAEQALKDSYGNVIKTKKGNLPRFTIGEVIFKDIPVGFFEGAIGRQQMSVMGGNLLKRFNIIIDANSAHIYLQSNQLKDLPF